MDGWLAGLVTVNSNNEPATTYYQATDASGKPLPAVAITVPAGQAVAATTTTLFGSIPNSQTMTSVQKRSNLPTQTFVLYKLGNQYIAVPEQAAPARKLLAIGGNTGHSHTYWALKNEGNRSEEVRCIAYDNKGKEVARNTMTLWAGQRAAGRPDTFIRMPLESGSTYATCEAITPNPSNDPRDPTGKLSGVIVAYDWSRWDGIKGMVFTGQPTAERG